MDSHRTTKFHNTLLRELSEEEIIRLMQEATAGSLGTIGEDGPYIVPVSFVFYNKHIYFHCHHDGKKLDNIQVDNRVCFQTHISTVDTLNYSSVIITGKAERVMDNQEAMEAMSAMRQKAEGHGVEQKPMPKTAAALAQMIKVYKIVDYKLSSKYSAYKN